VSRSEKAQGECLCSKRWILLIVCSTSLVTLMLRVRDMAVRTQRKQNVYETEFIKR